MPLQHDRDPWNVRALLEASATPFTIADYGPPAVIFRQGDPCDSAMHIERGRVWLAVTARSGKEAICGLLGTGAFLVAEASRTEAERVRVLAEEARALREQYREEPESVRQAQEARQAAEEARHATIAAVAATADALSANLAQMQFLEEARNTLRQLKSTKPNDVQ